MTKEREVRPDGTATVIKAHSVVFDSLPEPESENSSSQSGNQGDGNSNNAGSDRDDDR